MANPGWQPSQNTIWLMQSIGVSLQVINAGAAYVVKNAVATLVFAAVCAGYQLYVQRLGNNSLTPEQIDAIVAKYAPPKP